MSALTALDPAERATLEGQERRAAEAEARLGELRPLAETPQDQAWTELAGALFLLEEFRYLP